MAKKDARSKSRLSDKRAKFVREYLVDLNGRQAAIRSGYAKTGAHVRASLLLRDDNVRAAIQDELNEQAKRTHVSGDRVIMELARIAFANMGEYITVQDDGSAFVDLSTLTGEQSAAIQELTSDVYSVRTSAGPRPVRSTKLKLYPRTRALELLAKHFGIMLDRVEHTGADGGPIEVLDVAELSTETLKRLRSELRGGQTDRKGEARR